MFIVMLYGSGLPFIYLTTFLNLIILYWIDKYFILRVCQRPKELDQQLEVQLRKFMYLFLIIHLVFAIWVYGNEAIFDKNGGLDSNFNWLSKVQETNMPYAIYTAYQRAIRYQNLPLLIELILLIVAIVLK